MTKSSSGSPAFYTHAEFVHGSNYLGTDGKHEEDIGGDFVQTVNGNKNETVMGDVMSLIAGCFNLIIGSLSAQATIGSPQPVTANIGAPLGINCFGGIYTPELSGAMIDGNAVLKALIVYQGQIAAALAAMALTPWPTPFTGAALNTAIGIFAASLAKANAKLNASITLATSKRNYFGGPATI